MLSSCSPKVSTHIVKSQPALNYKEKVIVLQLNESPPENAALIGGVKVGDSGFTTNCGYEVIMGKAKMEARKLGGNVLKITDHSPPNLFGSSCHQIKAKIYKVQDLAAFQKKKGSNNKLMDTDYALFYIYRPSGSGFLVSYDMYLGDSLIWRAKNNSKAKLRIYKDGLNKLWASTETKTEVPIDVQMGGVYYIRCGIKMGAFVGRPSIQIVDRTVGRAEFMAVKNDAEVKDLIVRKNGKKIRCEITSEDADKVYFTFEQNGNEIDTHLRKEQIEEIEYGNENM